MAEYVEQRCGIGPTVYKALLEAGYITDKVEMRGYELSENFDSLPEVTVKFCVDKLFFMRLVGDICNKAIVP